MRNSKMHNGWAGFIPLRNEKGVIYAAKCEKCNIVYHKRDQETLSLHMWVNDLIDVVMDAFLLFEIYFQ